MTLIGIGGGRIDELRVIDGWRVKIWVNRENGGNGRDCQVLYKSPRAMCRVSVSVRRVVAMSKVERGLSTGL